MRILLSLVGSCVCALALLAQGAPPEPTAASCGATGSCATKDMFIRIDNPVEGQPRGQIQGRGWAVRCGSSARMQNIELFAGAHWGRVTGSADGRLQVAITRDIPRTDVQQMLGGQCANVPLNSGFSFIMDTSSWPRSPGCGTSTFYPDAGVIDVRVTDDLGRRSQLKEIRHFWLCS